MNDSTRWVYGRADDRFMDDDRLNGRAANLQGPPKSRKRRHGCLSTAAGIVLGGLVGAGMMAATVLVAIRG